MTTMKKASRDDFRLLGERPTSDEVKIGAIQRIADATEKMAQRYTELIDQRDRLERWGRDLNVKCARLERSNAALRGQITKLKKRLAE